MQKVRAFGPGKDNLKIRRKESHEEQTWLSFSFCFMGAMWLFPGHSTDMLIKLSNIPGTKFSVRPWY